MDKLTRYSNLVSKYKAYQFQNTKELANPHHNIEGFDFNVINPWELWHNDLDAEIIFIGQDFSDTKSLEENLKNDWAKEKGSPTNKKVIDFFGIIGYDLKEVTYLPDNSKHRLFFTNAILGIKQSDSPNMSKSVKNSWYKETLEYLKELIDIVEPKYIIAMGKIAYMALCTIYEIKQPKTKIAEAIGEPIELSDGKILFVVQHCSPLGSGTRPPNIQRKDWENIKEVIKQKSSFY